MTPEQLEARLKIAREAASYKAWCDMLAAFTQEQREHLARLLAHDWWISSVTLRQTEDGRDYTHTVTGEARTI